MRTTKFYCLLLLAISCLFSGNLAIAHPILADSPSAKNWHAPDDSSEAVFIGSDKSPVLVLKKSVVQGQSLSLTISTDGKFCVLRSGSVQVPLGLARKGENGNDLPEQTRTLKLDATSEPPSLLVDGQEVLAAKGKWIQICAGDAATISLELQGATYATVKFNANGTDAGSIDKDTPAKGDKSGSPGETVALARAKHGVFHLFIRLPDENRHNNPKEERPGTAFLIDPSGKAVTNYHVVHGAESATASSAGHPEQRLRVDLLGTLPGYDLALVQIHVEDAVIADTFPLTVSAKAAAAGQKVSSLGFPEAGYSISRGAVKAARKFSEMPDDMQKSWQGITADSIWIQSDCAVDPGSSGGPLVDEQGAVIGVNTWNWMEAKGNYFAVSAAHIDALIAQANSSPTNFQTDRGKFVGRGANLLHDVPADLPSITVAAHITPQQMVEAAIAYRSNAVKACPTCGGKGTITSSYKSGEVRGGGFVQPTYSTSNSQCQNCKGTGRALASPDALERLTDKLIAGIAGANTTDKAYADRVQAVTKILTDTIAVNEEAKEFYKKQSAVNLPLGTTKTGHAFVVFGTVAFTQPIEATHGQLYAINTGFKTVLVINPRIIDVAEGDPVVAGGLFAGRAGNGSSQMPVLQDGFAIRTAHY